MLFCCEKISLYFSTRLARADLDGDGVLDTISLSYERGRIYISISSLNKVLVKKDFTAIKLESVKVCEIDGKSPKEVKLRP